MAVINKQATIAARIDRVPLFSLHRKLVFVLGVGTFFDLFDVALGGLLAAILANIYHLNAFQTAAIIASGFFGMFVGALVLSIVSDYFGRRTMFLIDLLIYSLFSVAIAFSPNVTWVIIFRFFAGIGLGATPPLTDVYLSEMLPRQVRGRYTAWTYTVGLLGVPIAGLLSKVLVSTTFLMAGWRWLVVVGALGALVVWFCYDWVWKLCTALGADDADLVPFEKYAKAAEGLAKPSSAARALFGGAEHIERVDCLVRRIAGQRGLQSDALDEIVTLVDERLAKNRAARSPGSR